MIFLAKAYEIMRPNRNLENIKNEFINKFCLKKSSNDGVDSTVCIALELSLLYQPNASSMQNDVAL